MFTKLSATKINFLFYDVHNFRRSIQRIISETTYGLSSKDDLITNYGDRAIYLPDSLHSVFSEILKDKVGFNKSRRVVNKL